MNGREQGLGGRGGEYWKVVDGAPGIEPGPILHNDVDGGGRSTRNRT
jgi:hypothetical protein